MKLVPLLTAVTNGLYKPSFIEEPSQIIQAVVGQTVNLTCRVDGETKPNKNFVQWVKGNLALGFPPIARDRYQQRIGPDDYSLRIEDVQLGDEDDFECQITPFGMRSEVGRLEIIAPPKTVDITPVGKTITVSREGDREVLEVVEGEPTRLRCIATDSKPRTEIGWELDGDELKAQSTFSGDVLLTTVSELVLIPRREHNGLAVKCLALNDALPEPIEQLAYLNVQTTPDVVVELAQETIKEGDKIEAHCTAESNPPVLSYKWFLNDRILDSVSDKLVLEGVSFDMNGADIKCEATNRIGSSVESTRLGVQYLPRISQLDEAFVANKSAPFELVCDASGNPAPEITWTDDQGEIVSRNPVLAFAEIGYAHFGGYSCRAQNDLGEAVMNTNISVRGTPFIRSPMEQATPTLTCDFVAEPPADFVQIINIETDAVVYQSAELANTKVEVKLERGNYECRVNNALGMSSSQIILEPEVMAAGTRIGIVCAVMLILIIFAIGAMIKLRFFVREHRLKLTNSDDNSSYDREDNRMNYDISHPFPISAPIPAQASFTDKNRLSLLRSSDDEPISDSDMHQTHHHYHLHHHSQLNQTVSEKVLMIVPSGTSDTGSTGRSAHDDGYGTESGSNQKVHTVSSNSDASNSDYEVNVPSLSSSQPYGEKESKICVIWDDETTYEPAKYSLQMSRARSVSHV